MCSVLGMRRLLGDAICFAPPYKMPPFGACLLFSRIQEFDRGCLIGLLLKRYYRPVIRHDDDNKTQLIGDPFDPM